MTLRHRLLIAGLAGCGMAVLTYFTYGLKPPMASDFDILWLGLRAFVRGENPYRAVLDAHINTPLFYPLPALVVLAPLGLLSAGLARIVFAALGYAALAFAGAGRRRGGLAVALFSASALLAALSGQWSPLLTAGAAAPWLSVLWITKPNLGLALAAGYPSRQAIYGAIVLLALSFAIMPTWPREWLAGLGDPAHVSMILRPGGFLLLLAAFRWRRPEARLLVALACLPGSATLYETVPLFLVPGSRFEGYVLLVLSFVAAALQAQVATAGSVADGITARWPVLLVLLYLPAVIMVLRRPNEWPAAPDHAA